MHQRGQQRQLSLNPVTARVSARGTQRTHGALFAIASLVGLVGASSIGCNDKDTTDVVPTAGNGGSAGRGGSAGSAGTGGSAGTAGTAGNGGSAGSAGTAGNGGSAGDVPDGGVDSGAPTADSGTDAAPPPDPLEVRAEALCQLADDLDACGAPADGCVANYVGAQTPPPGHPDNCTDEFDDYYACLEANGTDSFTCRDDVPDFKLDLLVEDPPCPDEEAAYFNALLDPPVCD